MDPSSSLSQQVHSSTTRSAKRANHQPWGSWLADTTSMSFQHTESQISMPTAAIIDGYQSEKNARPMQFDISTVFAEFR
jgi:hypothetical protein